MVLFDLCFTIYIYVADMIVGNNFGKGSHKSRLTVLDGVSPEASGLGSNGDRGVSAACHGRGGPLRNVHHTETVVSAVIHTGAQNLPDRHVKGQGGFPDPLLEGGATPPNK